MTPTHDHLSHPHRSTRRPSRPRRSRTVLGAGALVLALAACSSTGDGSGAGSTASVPSSSTTPGATGPTSSTGSSTPSGPNSPAATTSGADDLPAGAKQLAVTVTGKKVSPPPGNIELRTGQVLRLTVTSDHDDELHAHGFEKEAELVAGKATTLDLVTDQPGTYEVETHHPALRLLKVQVR